MSDFPRRKGFCRNRIGARGLRIQIRSRGDQRVSFCSSITAARVFHRRPQGRGDPEFACRAGPRAGMASGRADRRSCRHDSQSEKELGLVEYRNARSANLDVFGPCRRHSYGSEMAHRGPHRYLIELMTPLNRQKVARAMTLGRRTVGTIYRRTRPDENGTKRQRAEVRFDDIAGCLRTPAGGSSRQTILVVEGKSVRSRLLSPREAARLMGLSDDLPSSRALQ